MSERSGGEKNIEEYLYQEYDGMMNEVVFKLVELAAANVSVNLTDREIRRIKELNSRRSNILEVQHAAKSKSTEEKIKSYQEIIPMLKELLDDMKKFEAKILPR